MERRSPYRGLDPFGEDDGEFLRGRARDTRVIVANLFASPLTVLHGPGGVGKSSVLNAGVLPALRAREGVAVEVVRRWAGDPAQAITVPGDPDAHRIVLILDQFEDALAGPSEALADALAAALDDPRVGILLAVRADSLSELDRCSDRLTGLFDTVLRLDYLDRAGGEEAIRAPLALWPEPVGAEPELVSAVLDGVPAAGGAGIETAHLQLVMDRVWEVERARRSRTLHARTLDELGGPAGIVGAHVRDALARLSAADRDLAAAALDRLVTPSGMRIAQRTSDLASFAGVEPARLEPVLDQLTRDRVLRPVDAPDGARHEVFHEILAGPIVAWLRERAAAEERRRWRRRLFLAVLGVLVAGAAAGFAAYARSQSQNARSVALAASSRRLLDVDPGTSLALALAAARERRTTGAEDALRAALAASNERAIVHGGGLLRSVALSGGDLLTAGDAGNAVTQTGVVQRGGARYAAYCPDRTRIVYGGEGGAFLQRGRSRLGELTHVTALACAGRRIVVQSSEGTTEVFDDRGTLVRRLHLKPAYPDGVRMSADGRFLVSTGDLGADVWRVDAGARVAHFGSRLSAALDRDGSRVVTGDDSGNVEVWNLVRNRPRRVLTLRGQAGAVSSLAFGTTYIVAGGPSRTAQVWDAAAGAPLAVLRGHHGDLTSVAVEGRTVATASADGSARLWSVPVRAAIAGQGTVFDVALTAGAGRIVTATDRFAPADGVPQPTGTVSVRTGAGREIAAFPGIAAGVLGLSRDGRQIVTVDDVTERANVLAVGAKPRVLGGPTRAAAISPDGRTFALGPDPGFVRIVGADGRTQHETRARGDDPIVAIVFSPDGRRVAAVHFSARVDIVDAASGALVRTLTTRDPVMSLAFAGADELVTGGTSAVRIWDVASGRLRQTIGDAALDLRSASLSGDGRLLLTAGRDGVGRLIDVRTGDAVSTLPAAIATFSPDGGLILTAGLDQVVRLYACDACGSLHELQARAERRVTRTLSEAELDAYAG